MKKHALLIVMITVILTLAVSVNINAAPDTSSAAETAIYEGLILSSADIDIGSYNITSDTLNAIYVKLLNTRPELFFVSTTYKYNYTESGTVTAVIPSYKYTGTELAAAQREYIAYVDAIAAGARAYSTDLERLLYIHDHLVLTYEYDMTLKSGDAYQMFRTGKGICTAYTLAFKAVCDRIGIECGVAESESMNHIWNVVKLDGQWYHVDVTWDDPTVDVVGRVFHTNFLLSDSAVRATSTPHSGWASEVSCTSTKYDSYMWKSVYSPFAYSGGKWYAIDGVDFIIYEYDLASGTRRSLYSCSEKWKVIGSAARYTSCYSGMAAYSGALYFNTPTAVCRYDIAAGSVAIVAEPDCSDGYIYYFTVDGDTLEYYIRERENMSVESVGYVDLDKSAQLFELTFKNGDEVVAVQYVAAGDTITPPSAPAKPGYAFTGWSGLPAVMPAEDITVSAVYSESPCEHTNTRVVTVEAATCDRDGKSRTVCRDCGEIILESIVNAAHTIGAWHVVNAATCISNGLRERECTVCGDVIESEVIVSSGIHDYGGWETVIEPTEDTAGQRRRVCGVCGSVDEEEIPSLSEGGESGGTDTAPGGDISGDESGTDSSTSPVGSGDGETEIDTDGTGGERRTGPSTKTVLIYIAVVAATGLINGSLIYIIVLHSRKPKKNKSKKDE